MTLGFFIFTYAVFIPDGSLLWAVVLSGGYLLLQAVTYASLVAAMPRRRRLHLDQPHPGRRDRLRARCGWWFILWHWVPIYANILNVEVIVPLASIIGWDGGVTFFSEDKGCSGHRSSPILASILVAVGVRTYAGSRSSASTADCLGLAFMFVLLLVNSKTDFISALNTQGRRGRGRATSTADPEGGCLGTSTADSVGTSARSAGSSC